jgi:hypothetical protein
MKQLTRNTSPHGTEPHYWTLLALLLCCFGLRDAFHPYVVHFLRSAISAADGDRASDEFEGTGAGSLRTYRNRGADALGCLVKLYQTRVAGPFLGVPSPTELAEARHSGAAGFFIEVRASARHREQARLPPPAPHPPTLPPHRPTARSRLRPRARLFFAVCIVVSPPVAAHAVTVVAPPHARARLCRGRGTG